MVVCGLLVVALSWFTQADLAASLESAGEVHEFTLELARGGAERKLARHDCRRVLEDYRDRHGRSLNQVLVTARISPADYVRALSFRDGSKHPRCIRDHSTMFTIVGLRAVFVCPAFRVQADRDPALAENWVIHEMLHTLGLGENPPSSREITRRVAERCR